MLVVVGLVALCYCGGNYCPTVLKQNKEMLLGVVVGIALCSFMDMRLEGVTNTNTPPRRVPFTPSFDIPQEGGEVTGGPTVSPPMFRLQPLGGGL